MSATIPDPHLGAWRGLLNAHAASVRAIELALRDAELPPLAWYDVLWALRRAPGRRLRMSELGDHVTISQSGLSRLVARIEAGGHLRRERADSDLRSMWATLAPSGEQLLQRMWSVYAAEIERLVVDVLDEDEARSLAESLGRIHAAAVGHAPAENRVAGR